MKRFLLVMNIFLGAGALITAAFAAKEAVVLNYSVDKTAVALEEAGSGPALALSSYAAIPEKGLFGKGTLSGAADSDAPGGPPGLVLVGTAEGAGYAVFMDTATGKQKAFRVGESVFGGAAVNSVSTKKAVLVSGGRKFTYSVPATLPALPAASAGQGAQVASKRGEDRWVVDQRAVSGVFDNMDKVLTDARFTPYIADGKLTGFRVNEVKPQGVFGLIGLEDGDVVLSINEYGLDSPGKVAQVLGGLKGESEVKVDLLRGGKPRTLRYQIR